MTNSVPPSRYWCFGLLAATALLGDLVSKWRVFDVLGYPFRKSDWSWSARLGPWEVKANLFTSFNQGALWGVGQGYSWLFATLSLVAAGFVIYWLFVRGEAKSWWLTVSLALIMAGTLGNLYDRLYLHGCTDAEGVPLHGVRDFLHFTIPFLTWQFPLHFAFDPTYEWPIFNFADTYLVTGAIMLTLHSFTAPKAGQEQPVKTGDKTNPAPIVIETVPESRAGQRLSASTHLAPT